jgi:hypothetical protein
VLVDGFANGWLVDPTALGGAVQDGTFDVTLTWAPQKRVDLALALSAAGAVLCLLLALLPNRWRRTIFFRRRRRAAVTAAGATGSGPVRTWARDDPPELTSPLSAYPGRPRWWAYVLAPVLAGGIAAGVLTRPEIGLAVAGAVLVILVVRHLRFLLTLTALGLVAATGVYTVTHQSVFHFPPGGWPINFEPASNLAWAAVVMLTADAIVEIARGVSVRRTVPDDGVSDNEVRDDGVPVEEADTPA